jgi:pimeloyl-ACP methyl ester carboxylesterase
MLRRWAILLGCIYLGFIVLMMLLETKLVYMAASADSWTPPGKLPAEDVELVSEDGTALHAWWIPAEGGEGAILFCHGQAGNLSSRGWLMQRLKRLNKPILLFDYPGYGRSEGSPTEAGCCAAGDAAYDWLVNEKKVPPARIILMGKSLGGGIAVDLASRLPHRALVLAMTYTTLPDVGQHLFPILPAKLIMRNRFDNLSKIGRCTGPVFLAHGTADWKIPMSHSEELYKAAPGPKRFFPMEGVGHGFPSLTDECLDELAAFLQQTDK